MIMLLLRLLREDPGSDSLIVKIGVLRSGEPH